MYINFLKLRNEAYAALPGDYIPSLVIRMTFFAVEIFIAY